MVDKRIHLAVIFSLPFCYFFEHYGNYTEIYISPDIQAMSTQEAERFIEKMLTTTKPTE
ncbi:hypothetical protein [Brevibacillus laterosporus]|uniref:hypothetical protein n=1 Tax=Brevibacillus laterosporus TaxID=1465 RepID=UPI001443C9C0|nr:hypothetical protein [Brevibacillus laterosporus]NKQ22842.1 hypothetical protein [Brevibacillus laterosporus]WNX30006.1 hypothetical protein RWW94_17485 [Brevibacillus laterosporus]